MNEHLVYILSLQQKPLPSLQITLLSAYALKSSGYSKGKPFYYLSAQPFATFLTEEDHKICKLLEEWRQRGHLNKVDNIYQIYEQEGVTVLLEILKTTRGFWASSDSAPLSLGETRYGHFSWHTVEGNQRRLQCRVSGKNLLVLPLIPLWYVDINERCCGPLETDFDPKMAIALLAASDSSPEQFKKIYAELEAREKSMGTTVPVMYTPEEWYSEIEDNTRYDWFNFELGIVVDGHRVNLLPLLLQLIQQYLTEHGVKSIDEVPPDTQLPIQLQDGKYLSIPVERVKGILQILTELYDKESLYGNEKLRLSRLRIAQLLELEKALGVTKLRWLGGEKLLQLGEKLRNFTGVKPVPVPAHFRTSLRDYQQQGLNWLQFLREYELAGILADDMGLGKTVQALAHLLVEKQSGRMDKPSLIIAPTSLMTNWRVEAERFAPDLKVLTLHGQTRKKYFSDMKNYDVILTTYPLLIRDKKALLAQDYHLLILDEAQVIKNAKAKSTQIAIQLQARHRVCLTGTPLENHLTELWSLFNFLLPGLLGKQAEFKRLFASPIEKLGDSTRRESLVKRIAPFMLRRTKQQVITELPAKSEIICNVELEDAQLDLYESIRIAMHAKISSAIKRRGLQRSHIIVLEALLRLRQVCCDPRLLKIEAAQKMQQSAKMSWLVDTLPNLIDEGRKVLLFSSFSSMLKLIEEQLNELNIPYEKLTGKTIDRDTPIRRFQTGEVPLFLISLKAGGLGLNLTAADTVIHYDPWWNPAAENQATDRAHRIGQNKAVFVYKLITKGTVEEKILTLQNKKQTLLEGLFSEQMATSMRKFYQTIM